MRSTHDRSSPTFPVMKLYFSPLACSLATRIALYEANVAADLVEVDPKTKRTSDGRSFLDIHPLGLVPLLETDDGALLSENAAILQYVAARHPEAGLAPSEPFEQARLHQWLGFIATELHKVVFVPLLDEKAPKDVKAYALSKADVRLEWVARHLANNEWLLDRFSVADAYLFTVLNWAMVTPIDLDRHPSIRAFQQRMRARPSVERAFGEERVLYAKELARGGVSAALRFATSLAK